jgi:hypothetical protein
MALGSDAVFAKYGFEYTDQDSDASPALSDNGISPLPVKKKWKASACQGGHTLQGWCFASILESVQESQLRSRSISATDTEKPLTAAHMRMSRVRIRWWLLGSFGSSVPFQE